MSRRQLQYILGSSFLLIVMFGFMVHYLRTQNNTELEQRYHTIYHGVEPPECTPYDQLSMIEQWTTSSVQQRDEICKQWFIEQNRPWYINSMTNPLLVVFDLGGQCLYTSGSYIVKLLHLSMRIYSIGQSWIEYFISLVLIPIVFICTIIILYYLVMWSLPLLRECLLYKHDRDKCIIDAEKTRERECIPYRLQIKEYTKQL